MYNNVLNVAVHSMLGVLNVAMYLMERNNVLTVAVYSVENKVYSMLGSNVLNEV